jgi:class 3 adenylate cyclase
METQNRSNRTWLCTVIFMDIVGYSRLSVSQQLEIKQRYNQILSSAIESIPARDRLILDTGDGAAVCFLGDPEDVLFTALELREAFGTVGAGGENPFYVRTGVNLGPVKLIRDVNGSLNAIGDGVNAAQRIMGFAEPNSILVSRSFYEVVSCLSEEYEKLFEFEGTRQDKHVREHTVYRLHAPAGPLSRAQGAARAAASGAAAADDDLLNRIREDLSESLGPVAEVVVRRAAASASEPGELIGRIAEELPDAQARAEFLAKYGAEPPFTVHADSQPAMGEAPAFLEGLLAEYVGPVSRILVKRAASKAASAEELVTALEAEIPDQAEQAEFRRRVSECMKESKE